MLTPYTVNWTKNFWVTRSWVIRENLLLFFLLNGHSTELPPEYLSLYP